VLQSTLPGRLRHVVFSTMGFSCQLADLLPNGGEICLPQVAPASVKSARYATSDLAPQAALANSGSRFSLPATSAGTNFMVTW
jgi:hypothetical protein